MAELGEEDLAPRFNTADTQTNITGSGNPVIVVNQEKKKKPYDVQFGKTEPKIKPNMKYSSKQSYRRYKTKTEPNLNSNIMVNEEDDIVKQIKKAFGINPENTNYSSVESAPMDPNYFNFQTPAEYAPIQTGQNPDIIDNMDDDMVLFQHRREDLNIYDTNEFDKILEEIEKEDISKEEKLKKANEALEKYIIDNNIKGVYRKEQVPQLRKIKKLTLNEAKKYYDDILSAEEKVAFDIKFKDDMAYMKTDYQPEYIPTDNQYFIDMIQQEQLVKLKNENFISDTSKASEEALTGLKLADDDKLPLDSDDGKSATFARPSTEH